MPSKDESCNMKDFSVNNSKKDKSEIKEDNFNSGKDAIGTNEDDKKDFSCDADITSELKGDIVKLENKLLREKADFENMRSRLEREKVQSVLYAHENFARDLLVVIDSLESAIESALSKDSDYSKESELLRKLAEGIELTINQVKKIYAKHGIELVDVKDGFNPHFHEVVMELESKKHKKGEIVKVIQKGYKIKDRVLRPAIVTIAK